MDGARVRFCFILTTEVDSFAASDGLPSPGPVSFMQSIHTSYPHPPSNVIRQRIKRHHPSGLTFGILDPLYNTAMAPNHSTGKWYFLTHLAY